jgi:16S rRNA C967 or C1407 C5-methylase (RsmB/RsmF family)
MRTMLGSECDELLHALCQEPSISIRINNLKPCSSITAENLPIAWCRHGRYLTHRPHFALDPLMYAGAYYVQESASMLLCSVVEQLFSEPIAALDLCAAPGGKTTLLAQYLPQDSIILSNEAIRSRTAILAENVIKWGNPSILITNNDPKCFAHLPPIFDLLLVDAPCSGEGMFRREPAARHAWNSDIVKLCTLRQRRIAGDAWHCLKHGGILIYCTCTFNTEENERNAAWIAENLGADSIPLNFDNAWNVMPSQELCCNVPKSIYGYRCMPHRIGCEGLFITAMRKRGGSCADVHSLKKINICRHAFPLRHWLLPEPLYFEQADNSMYVFPLRAAAVYCMLKSHLRFDLLPQRMASINGEHTAPAAALALSVLLNKEAFPQHELGLVQARNYLRGMPQSCSAAAQRGHCLMEYAGLPLGFAHCIGSRSNNLYPKGWRLRTTTDFDSI